MTFEDLTIINKKDIVTEDRNTHLREYQWKRYVIKTKSRYIKNITNKPDIVIECQCIDNGPNIEWLYDDFVLTQNSLSKITHSKDIDEYINNTIDAKTLIEFMLQNMNQLIGES